MFTKRIAPSIRQIARFSLVVVLGATAVATAKAQEYTYAQRIACTPDAFRLCSSEIPDVDAVKACMISNIANLSPGCRAMFPKHMAAR